MMHLQSEYIGDGGITFRLRMKGFFISASHRLLVLRLLDFFGAMDIMVVFWSFLNSSL